MPRNHATSLLTVGISGLFLLTDAAAQNNAVIGDASPQDFAQFCRADLPRQRQERFEDGLNRAQQALAAGQAQRAADALGDAEQAAYRGGVETDVSVKCFGEPTYRRWFDTKTAVWRLGFSANSQGDSFAGLQDVDRYALLALDEGSKAVVANVTAMPSKRFRTVFQTVQRVAGRIDDQRRYGAFILSEEARIETNCRSALAELRAYATQQIDAALAAEEVAFNRPATQSEQQGMRSLGAVGQLSQAMAGVDAIDPDADAAMLITLQNRDSRDQLRIARDYELDPPAQSGKDASGLRAEQRGTELLARADDGSRSLRFRDSVYELAIDYFDWCECRDQKNAAQAARDAIQPALAAEEAEREAKMEAATARMRQDAEQAMQDIQKTDAEKKSFQEEADAMEAELGF